MEAGQPTPRRRNATGVIVGLVVGVLLLNYGVLYVAARLSHFLVHERAITFDAHGHQLVLEHSVRWGDVGFPTDGLVTFFTPLRWLEARVWGVIEPVGKPVGLP